MTKQTHIHASTDFANSTATGSELVTAYNYMVSYAKEIGLEDVKEVSRFADSTAGKRRCEQLQSRIRAREASNKAVDEGKGPDLPAHETTASDVAGETAQEGNAGATEGGSTNDEETDDMAKKAKKAAKKAAPKAARKPRETGGETIKTLTEEYNNIVKHMTKAQKEAAPYAKHHTSLFESKDKAKVQLARLKKDIAKA